MSEITSTSKGITTVLIQWLSHWISFLYLLVICTWMFLVLETYLFRSITQISLLFVTLCYECLIYSLLIPEDKQYAHTAHSAGCIFNWLTVQKHVRTVWYCLLMFALVDCLWCHILKSISKNNIIDIFSQRCYDLGSPVNSSIFLIDFFFLV